MGREDERRGGPCDPPRQATRYILRPVAPTATAGTRAACSCRCCCSSLNAFRAAEPWLPWRAIALARSKRQVVVHEPAARAQAPERGRPDLVPRRRASVLDDAVTGADVVQQEVAERVDDLVAERVGDPQRAAVDPRPRRRGDDGPRVARRAADGVEDLAARPARSGSPHGAASTGGALVDRMNSANSSTSTPSSSEPGNRIGHDGAVGRVLVRLQRAGDAHLVDVGVRGERDQARLLVLVAEASDAGRSRASPAPAR